MEERGWRREGRGFRGVGVAGIIPVVVSGLHHGDIASAAGEERAADIITFDGEERAADIITFDGEEWPADIITFDGDDGGGARSDLATPG